MTFGPIGLPERDTGWKALEAVPGSSQEQDLVELGLPRAGVSDSLCRKETRCCDFYWLQEQREGPWQS